MDTNYLIVLVVIVVTFGPLKTQEPCSEISRNEGGARGCSNFDTCYPTSSTYWYQINFWGGYLEIAWRESSISSCAKHYIDRDFLVLMNKPPAREDINETVLSLEACIRNQNELCKDKVVVYIRNCGGDLVVQFPWVHVIRKVYVCLDYMFSGGCNDPLLDFTAEEVSENVIEIALCGHGWYNTFYEGKQYTFPSTEYTEMIFDACPKFDAHFLLQDPVPESIKETPVKLTLCKVSRVSHETGVYYNTDCNYVIYFRKCNGTVQFETTWASTNGTKLCLVHRNGVEVIPEIGHTIQYVYVDGISTTMYAPSLQFRCSFEMDAVALYNIKWYVNNTLYTEKEPSKFSEDLTLKGDDKNDLDLGYMIKCGVIDMTVNESYESLSLNFFAGWKVSDKDVELTKGGSVNVDVELTVPIGCAYTDNEQARCTEELSITDSSYIPDICKGGILVTNADDTSKSYHEVQTLKQDTEWNRSKKYRFKLSTSDVNYDDPVAYDLQVRLTNGADSKVIETLHIDITDATRYWNKLCYSHVDPHMRTADGSYYEQQREGDYMLFRNIAHQMEIQESTRYCSPPWHSSPRPPPVCACGIAIRFGGDLFMINRCSRVNLLDFVQCGDGGILEVDRIDDYRYRVRAPTGTLIDITIHSRGKTMNIDVYVSPRDFGNIDGLCGYFDGNTANDFLLRDRSFSDGNTDYRFSDSWRLSDEENLFTNLNRVLEPWHNKQNDRTCSKPNSITKTKCNLGRRFKRGYGDVRRDFERLYSFTSTRDSMRSKRNAQAPLAADEVASLCNASIFGSPSVVELQDKLADEDLSEVVAQCVYDVTIGNDTVWVEAHVQALNNIVITVLELNPVFAASNTELVKKFLSRTCLNNCSDNGACSDTGHCLCNDPYYGPDCSIDLRIPPIINDIEGGGICDVTTGNDCECFVIRTDNIFDGFMCRFSIYKVFFNGTRSQAGQLQQAGEYEDIFTGICCVSEELIKRPEDISDPFIVMYELSISNDAVNYGETIPVYVYDTTCIRQVLTNENTEVEIMAGNCFIGGTCVKQGSPGQGGDQCVVCDPSKETFRWYKGNCDDIRAGLTSAPLTGIIIGSFVGFCILTSMIFVVLCKATKKHRFVRDVHYRIQVSPVNLDLRVQDPHDKKTNADKKAGATDTMDFGEYVAVRPRIHSKFATKHLPK